MDEHVLSAAGKARRESMLAELDAAMARRNSRRIVVRTCGAVAPLVLIAAVIWGRGNGPGKPGTSTPFPIAEVREAAPSSLIQFVQTDPGILERVLVKTAEPRFTVISDDELQSLLASMGKPNGFVRTGGRVMLITDLRPPPVEHELERVDPGASS